MKITCKCGEILTEDNIDIANCCNEEGEDYATIEAICSNCRNHYRVSQWGHWENNEEAINELKEIICK